MAKSKAGRGRFSSRKKVEAVLRVLRGEDLDLVSRELGPHRGPGFRMAGPVPGRWPGKPEESGRRRPG
ncbi:MAG: hypothetical protein KatS3mg082_1840 [Nitrospiraceae bacterium]|nr:MAG: hypothetical protein KatS3mg082_1840 [Nitrospiraceae bacterium]